MLNFANRNNVLLFLLVFFLGDSLLSAQPSQCYGSSADGSIENSIQLPITGDNFVIYHWLGNALGRNFVHSKVRNVILSAYVSLNKGHPYLKFKYAETGWRKGGLFRPHKTHQNGLSVDFMVPIKDADDNSAYFRTDTTNQFGYAVEFDEKGGFQEFKIDFEALGLHLVALDKSAKAEGIRIRRIIFAPKLRQKLFETNSAHYLKNNITFMKNKAWVRHDEHYHVDFAVSCKKIMQK